MRVRQIYIRIKMIYYYIFTEEAHERCPDNQVGEKDNDHEYDENCHLSIDKIFEVCLGRGF